MPLRFYRRFRAGPFRLNVSKGGVSYSLGTRGAWFTAGRRHIRTSIGLPGTGLYWYQQHRLSQRRSGGQSAPAVAPLVQLPTSTPTWLLIARVAAFVIIVGIVLFVTGALLAH